ncbi:MAG: YerC/YecD family TrpR-related protein [Clostridiales bacterium]|nr:YerC/YecD family TrpR-related protein [Clostridiales bacterium]
MLYDNKTAERLAGLYSVVVRLDSLDDCARFFEDLCTINELQSMAQRWEVAKFLKQGLPYTEIGALTGASSATISRVNRALNHGADGYLRMLEITE